MKRFIGSSTTNSKTVDDFNKVAPKSVKSGEGVSKNTIDISEFIGLTKDKISKILDDLPVGTVITGITSRRKQYEWDTSFRKDSTYKANYSNPVSSPLDWKYKNTYWSVEGSEDPYIVSKIYEIANDQNKYYIMRQSVTGGGPSVTSAKDAISGGEKRASATVERYKGYLIVLDRGGDGYNVYDKHRELEEEGLASMREAKLFVDGLKMENVKSSRVVAYLENTTWEEVASKQVPDSDGFLTDYTMYTDGVNYIFMFGDKDIYGPDFNYSDYDTVDEDVAWSWFNSYNGFADVDEYNDDEYPDPDYHGIFSTRHNKSAGNKKGSKIEADINITEEVALKDFEFWSGAVDVANYLTDGEFEIIEDYINETYPSGIEKTELNDLFQFEDDFIATLLGYSSFDEIIEERG